MCLIAFDWQPDAAAGPVFTLVANRDEFFRRTSAPLSWWEDVPGLLAGRDLEAGGTWLGVSRDGRFAALTNYRAPFDIRAGAPTRGKLVSDYLGGQPVAPLDYLARLAEHAAVYNGFNLLVGDWKRRELAWFCNRAAEDAAGVDAPVLVPAGVHALSNGRLDTPWPKVVRKRAELGTLLTDDPAPPLDDLIALMRDTHIAADDALPHTGIPLERERALSAAFIETPEYGTRGTTALRVTMKEGVRLTVEIKERCDDDGSHRIVRPGAFERAFTFDIDATQAR
ncbi:NRDE family protein [Burkholderia ubonensis]|uniref:NRDE family protein n=1 Tax=Burkholderia ubonensis TaxID=101571 RepID=A0A118DBP9_9BURK|nr:NRDE family protein [Burkholderia ubonensis]KUZ72784.1 NRDE family protein [Burkholderia ubonensis]KUZ76639.1 NRDE family protein [Burkholderia ubonensis]KUZ84874.1 NRDE family protein [Burkholderia ubonensis]KUZ96621.1 NRDE family protein [Burkholderia ubonensis]KVC63408.1 NRDE family protein [Burkholderia ubonensis]